MQLPALILRILFFACLLCVGSVGSAVAEEGAQHAAADHGAVHAEDTHAEEDSHGAMPAAWSVIPFVVLLLAIAVCPLILPHFWHHHYPKVAIILGCITAGYYLAGLHQYIPLVHVGFEYLGFIALLTGLFVASGGIVIDIDKRSTTKLNVGILAIGALIANIIGTTGAAMLLIRPFMRVNKGRLSAFHVVFFIFIVANCGGALTPIGDPPLFLGFLKGIAFFQFFELNVLQWLVTVSALLAIFAFFDSRGGPAQTSELPESSGGGISLRGLGNFGWLAIIVGAVFLDPNKISWLPCVTIIDHHHLGVGLGSAKSAHVEVFSFIREIIMFAVAFLAYRFARRENLDANGFNFEPIKEVGYLFIGIFLTMVPALAIIKAQAEGGSLFGLPLNADTFYYGTGALSAVLDNAPTFISFLAGLEGKAFMNAEQISRAIADGSLSPAMLDQILQALNAKIAASSNAAELARLNELKDLIQTDQGQSAFTAELALQLSASAVAAVFWGAMTYIGNGPNFMVKSIADNARDENGEKVVHCPSFFGYVIRYSLPFLLPVLLLNWLIFYSGWIL